MSETSTIKESCSCGATLEYTERVSEPYYSHQAHRQSAFHKEHKACRQNKDFPAKTANQKLHERLKGKRLQGKVLKDKS